MTRKLLHDISANTLQVAINQGCGLLVFYLLSLGMGKDAFGELNWSLAVLLSLFGICSFGIDQVAVRRVAAGAPAASVLSLYQTHVLGWGTGLYLLLTVGHWLFPAFFSGHHLLLLLGAGKLAIFFSTPYKQVATGMQRFGALLFMATFANLLRSLALLLLFLLQKWDTPKIVAVFVAADVAEWLLSAYIVRYRLGVRTSWGPNPGGYRALLKEAAPQLLSVVLTTALARLDWVLLGLLGTPAMVAHYSFAWKGFEAATLPLLILGPLLLARFAKKLSGAGPLPPQKIQSLLRLEMAAASGTALLLNLLWAPVVDGLTKGGYGAVNNNTILLLSATLPLLYLNNLLWTLHFAKHHMKTILTVIGITFAVNLLANLWVIPQYGGEGAAAAFLLATLVQAILYGTATGNQWGRWYWLPVLVSPCCAVVAHRAAQYTVAPLWALVPLALLLYGLLLLACRQLRPADFSLLRNTG
jgi:O-antigen/teichoic acid export membrane protein